MSTTIFRAVQSACQPARTARPLFRALVAGGIAAVLGCLPAGAQAPREVPGLISTATAARDAAALGALYAPNAILLTPQGRIISGREAIQAVFAANHAMGPNTLRVVDAQADVDGNRALLLMSWELRIEPANKPVIETRGRSMLYFIRNADGWRIAADMFQNLPPAR